MSQTTSTVSHDLTQWSTAELELRYDLLTDPALHPNSYAEATSDAFNRLLDRTLCGCGEGETCVVDDYTAIDRELADR
jgi:hypothetical protein